MVDEFLGEFSDDGGNIESLFKGVKENTLEKGFWVMVNSVSDLLGDGLEGFETPGYLEAFHFVEDFIQPLEFWEAFGDAFEWVLGSGFFLGFDGFPVLKNIFYGDGVFF